MFHRTSNAKQSKAMMKISLTQAIVVLDERDEAESEDCLDF